MADVHIHIDIHSGNAGKGLAAVVKAADDGDLSVSLLATGKAWWHKPPDNARALISRWLSAAGCTGRLSVQPWDGGSFDDTPEPVWTGFTARTKR